MKSTDWVILLSALLVQSFGLIVLIVGKAWDLKVERERRQWEAKKEEAQENKHEEVMAGIATNQKISASTLELTAIAQGKTAEEVLSEANTDLDKLLKRHTANEGRKRRGSRPRGSD